MLVQNNVYMKTLTYSFKLSVLSIGMPYLDVIHRLRAASHLPIAAYHVSGEYAMMKAAAQKVCLHMYTFVYI